MEDILILLWLATVIALIVGLTKPTVFKFLASSWQTRGRISLLFGLLSVVFLILLSASSTSEFVGTMLKTGEQLQLVNEECANPENISSCQSEAAIFVRMVDKAKRLPNDISDDQCREGYEVFLRYYECNSRLFSRFLQGFQVDDRMCQSEYVEAQTKARLLEDKCQ